MPTPTAATPSPSTMDKVVNLLCGMGWLRDRDLTVKGHPDRPVFRKKGFTFVVGPLWTTYYKLAREVILGQDSIKTADYDAVKRKVEELGRG